MKFNLKNFPNWNPYASETDKHRFLSEVFEWLEGFELELRDLANGKVRVIEGEPIISIKELLGE